MSNEFGITEILIFAFVVGKKLFSVIVPSLILINPASATTVMLAPSTTLNTITFLVNDVPSIGMSPKKWSLVSEPFNLKGDEDIKCFVF